MRTRSDERNGTCNNICEGMERKVRQSRCGSPLRNTVGSYHAPSPHTTVANLVFANIYIVLFGLIRFIEFDIIPFFLNQSF